MDTSVSHASCPDFLRPKSVETSSAVARSQCASFGSILNGLKAERKEPKLLLHRLLDETESAINLASADPAHRSMWAFGTQITRAPGIKLSRTSASEQSRAHARRCTSYLVPLTAGTTPAHQEPGRRFLCGFLFEESSVFFLLSYSFRTIRIVRCSKILRASG